MTETIFTDWLKKLNARFAIENRKILLSLDNFGGHSPNKGKEPYNFSNIKIVYYPRNCTSVIQPMDQGIIQSFKVIYRKQIISKNLNQ